MLCLRLCTAGLPAGCSARQGWCLWAVCAKDVSESHFHFTCFSLKRHQCVGGEALLLLLVWVAWKPPAEPALARAELRTEPQPPR